MNTAEQKAPVSPVERLANTRRRLEAFRGALHKAQEDRLAAMEAFGSGGAAVDALTGAESSVLVAERGIQSAEREVAQLEQSIALASVAEKHESQVSRLAALAEESYAARDRYARALEQLNDAIEPLMTEVMDARQGLFDTRTGFLAILREIFGYSRLNSMHSRHLPELDAEVRALVDEVESRGVSADLVLANMTDSQFGFPLDRSRGPVVSFPGQYGEAMGTLIRIAAYHRIAR